jgi:transaldolase
MLQQNPLRRLHGLGQSVWLDYIRRDLVRGPELPKMIRQDALAGMTSNPTIFQKAIADSSLYDEDIARFAARGLGAEDIYERLTIADVTAAADAFIGVWEASGGTDGYVSLEVSPRLAHDAAGTVAEVKRLYNLCSRPNVMIKIPGTAEGLSAIRESLFNGIPINVTLLFGLARYQDVLRFYLDAMDQRLQMKQAVRQIRSVASFFVSRVDTVVDARLVAISKDSRFKAAERDLALSLLHKAAIANARMAYRAFQEAFAGPIYQRLSQHFIAKQRPLWASTSTKDPKLADLYYVEALIGADTVDTMPPATIDAFRDHGRAEIRVSEDPRGTDQILSELGALGIDLDAVGAELEADGLKKFAESYDALIGAIERKRSAA